MYTFATVVLILVAPTRDPENSAGGDNSANVVILHRLQLPLEAPPGTI